MVYFLHKEEIEQNQSPEQPDINLDTIEASAESYTPEKVQERLLKITQEFQLVGDAVYGGLYEARTHGTIASFSKGEENSALLKVVEELSLDQRMKVAEIIGELKFTIVVSKKPGVEHFGGIADAGEALKQLLFPNLPRYKK